MEKSSFPDSSYSCRPSAFYVSMGNDASVLLLCCPVSRIVLRVLGIVFPLIEVTPEDHTPASSFARSASEDEQMTSFQCSYSLPIQHFSARLLRRLFSLTTSEYFGFIHCHSPKLNSLSCCPFLEQLVDRFRISKGFNSLLCAYYSTTHPLTNVCYDHY